MTTSTQWFERLTTNLVAQNYTIKNSESYDGTTYSLVAHRGRFEITKFGYAEYFYIVSELQSPTLEQVKQACAKSFTYGYVHRKLQIPAGIISSCFVFQILLVNHVSAEIAEYITSTIPPKHWAKIEFPTVVDLSTGRVYVCEKTPLWGAAYFNGLRSKVKAMLGIS
jgi:hypothetical protein